ncbi:CU044_5270 family protein [Streptomyces sp. NPDC056069]|uniref:CU044_5270 family protein n=1 Tax=Streptomyces sp. NPDC056069 TaxID=3345702 RepID=UPI0035E10889
MKSPADDARLRAELADLLPPPEVPDLSPERRLALRREVLSTAGARPRRRVPRFAVPAVGGAVAAGLVLVVLAGGSPAPPAPRADVVAAPDAGHVLGRAALAAAAAPRTAVRPEQFVYIESLVAYAGRRADGGPASPPAAAHRRQVWLSADGTRQGLLRETGAPDTPLDVSGPVERLAHRGATPEPGVLGPGAPSIARPTHAYVSALPTDPEVLLRLVYAQTRPPAGGDPHQRAFTAIGTLLAETWAPPSVTAALYEAAARIPGTTVLESAKDAAGREGVAVARAAGGEQTQWVFDRSTSAFLGERTVLTRATAAGPAGTVLGSSAVLARAVTNRPGEHPPVVSTTPRP